MYKSEHNKLNVPKHAAAYASVSASVSGSESGYGVSVRVLLDIYIATYILLLCFLHTYLIKHNKYISRYIIYIYIYIWCVYINITNNTSSCYSYTKLGLRKPAQTASWPRAESTIHVIQKYIMNNPITVAKRK